jgi:RNA polymerase sigma-70 factor (ECF subfamily)
VEYAQPVFAYVRTIVRDDHAAEDVTQHVFAKLITSIRKYEPRSVPFSAWILRVARNAAIDHRRERRSVPCAEVRGADVPSDEGAFELRRSLADALRGLPYDQRRVLVLRHFVGLSPAEIADELSRSERAIHGLHHRGRIALRTALAASEAAPALAPGDRIAC